MILKRSLVTELSNTVGGVFTVLYTIVLAVGMVRVLSLASGGAIGNSEVLQMILYNSLTYIAPLLALSLFVAVLITMMRWWQDNVDPCSRGSVLCCESPFLWCSLFPS